MYIFIINPVAGNGRGKRAHLELIKDPAYAALDPVHYYTKYSGHAEVIAQAISEEVDGHLVQGIVVIGGDGTLHEVVNGLCVRHLPISFLPSGSGNDFARGMDITKNPKEMLAAIKDNEQTLDYWLGIFETRQSKNNFFVNCIGFGFDAVVAASANKSRYKKFFNRIYLGSVIYLFALLKELIFYQPISLTVHLDGVEKKFTRCIFFLVNNHPYFGGGMKVNPYAQNNKTDYSIVVVDSVSKWKVLALFGTIFSGRHLGIKGVSTYQAKEITINAEQPVLFQVDGETNRTAFCSIKKPPHPIYIKKGSRN